MRLRNVVMFYCSQLQEEQGESTFHSGVTGYPDAWHEHHTLEVQFLTAEQDLAFNHLQKWVWTFSSVVLSLTPVSQVHPIINLPSSLKCSSTLCLQKVPPVVPCPSGTAAPSLDCPGARAILEHYMDLTLSESIPNTLRALEQLFDESHEMLWVKVLDSLMSCEDEEQLNRLPVHCYPFKMHLQPCWIQTLGMVFVRQVHQYPSRMQKLKMPARMPC